MRYDTYLSLFYLCDMCTYMCKVRNNDKLEKEMEQLVQVSNYEVWETIKHGPSNLYKEISIRDSSDICVLQFNNKVLHILFSTLGKREYIQVSMHKNVEEFYERKKNLEDKCSSNNKETNEKISDKFKVSNQGWKHVLETSMRMMVKNLVELTRIFMNTSSKV